MDKQYGMNVDRSSLPTRKQGGIDWGNSIGCEVTVSSADGEFTEILTIINVRKEGKNTMLTVHNDKYGKKEFIALSFKKGKCFSGYFNFTKKHQFLRKEEKVFGLRVIDVYKRNGDSGDTCYNIECIKCNETYKQIKHSTIYSSNKRCNSCGTVMYLNGANKVGSEMYSLPERMIKYYLDECGVDYVKEYSPSWANRKRYDFYLKECKAIIEVHGGFHYNKNAFSDLDTVKSNDLLKRENAFKNGINKYYEIDCRKSNCLYIKEQIIKTLGGTFPNSENVNWGYIFAMSQDSKIFEISKMYMENKKDILYRCSSKYKMSKEAIVNKLMKGYGLGLNNYGINENENEKDLYKQKEDKQIDIYIPTLSGGGEIEYLKVGSSPNRFVLEQFGFCYNSKTVYVGRSSPIKSCCENNVYSVGGFIVVYSGECPKKHESIVRDKSFVKNGNEKGFEIALKKCVGVYIGKLL